MGDGKPRQRLRSIIRQVDPAEEQRREANKQAFADIVNRYVHSKFETPLIRSGMAMLDETATQHGWSENTSIFIADCELTFRKALGDSGLIVNFYKWFIFLEITQGVDEPIKQLSRENARKYDRIQQRIGAELRRRKIYPSFQYFGNRKSRREA